MIGREKLVPGGKMVKAEARTAKAGERRRDSLDSG